VAFTHSLVSISMGLLLVELALLRFDGMPCARPWNPDGANLGQWWFLYFLGFLLVTTTVPRLELLIFGRPIAAAILLGIVVAVSMILRTVALRKPRAAEDTSAFAPGDVLSLQ
jgi:hypothetical protein